MTTKNVSGGIAALRKAQAEAAQGVRTRADEVVKQADAVQARSKKEQEDAAIAARLLLQAAADELNDLDEEGGQLATILVGPPPTPEPVPAPAPVAEPDPDPAPTAPAAGGTTTVVVVPDGATAEANASVVVVNGGGNPTDPRTWGVLAIILACVGALIGFVIADGISFDEWVRAHTSVAAGIILTVFWWGGWMICLAGLAGYIGARIEGWRRRQAPPPEPAE